MGVTSIGVDPATNVVKNINSDDVVIYNDCFNKEVSNKIINIYGKVDAVFSFYSFAHIDDMEEVMLSVDNILKEDGIFIFELYYLGTLIDEMQYDNIYHEHMSYYSIESLQIFLKKFGMEIYDIKHFPDIRSGATRFYAKYLKNKSKSKTNSFKDMLSNEKIKGFNKLSTLLKYADKVQSTKKILLDNLKHLKRNGKKIVGYGASGRSTTIMNYCGIDNTYLDYVIDDAPAKHKFYTPGTHLKIQPWEHVKKVGYPDYILILSWAFVDEIMEKRKDFKQQGGKFIIPLPEVRIL